MHRLSSIVAAWALVLALPAAGAAQGQRIGEHDHAAPSEHVHAVGREIKALSPEEMDQLLAGEGMGLALAAELNGVPGPKHVLELASELALSEEQRAAVERIRAEMATEAQRLGRRIVHLERELDRGFAKGRITGAETTARSEEIGRLRGRLRAVHLSAHLETAEVLSAEQRARYVELRGYGSSPD